jgi:thiamine-phosphate pyrophosphorylase
VAAASIAIDSLIELMKAAAEAGVDLVQIRERDLPTSALTDLVGRAVEATSGSGVRVLVNDRVDVAVAAGAHGVHLRADSVDASQARTLVGPDAVVGRSVHDIDEAVAAARSGGLDYLIFGTLFATASKSRIGRLSTMGELGAACLRSGLPVLAIGGMTVERAAEAARAGAAGIAAIRLFVPPAGEPMGGYLRSVVGALRRTFDTCKALS